VLVQELAHLGQLLRVLLAVVLQLLDLDLDERGVQTARVDVVYLSFILRIEATAGAA